MNDTRWKLWQVALQIRSPVHSGYRKLGNVQMTRPYVTGKMLWGALTAYLTRAIHGSANGSAYLKMGQDVNARLALSYFYPSTRADVVDPWPWDDPDRFAWLYLSSYASTALDYNHFAALDGSLHETEFIRPNTPDGKRVFLVGYVAEDTTAEALPWKKVMHHFQVGGERGYGWGRLEANEASFVQSSNLFDQSVKLKGPRPLVTLQAKTAILSHALANCLTADGPIEPLVGREWHNDKAGGGRGAGQDTRNRGICYTPGSKAAAGTAFRIGPYGIWEAVGNDS